MQNEEIADEDPVMHPAPRPRLINEWAWFVLCLLVYAVLGLVLFGGHRG